LYSSYSLNLWGRNILSSNTAIKKFKAENRNAQQNKYIDPLDKERKNNSKKSNNTPGCLQSL